MIAGRAVSAASSHTPLLSYALQPYSTLQVSQMTLHGGSNKIEAESEFEIQINRKIDWICNGWLVDSELKQMDPNEAVQKICAQFVGLYSRSQNPSELSKEEVAQIDEFAQARNLPEQHK